MKIATNVLMDTKILQEIGLTSGETKVYLALLKLGSTKTGPLAKEANVSSSKVYKILDRLMKKGLAGHIIRGKIKYFQAMEPSSIINYLDEKEKQMQEKRKFVEQLLPQLENRKNAGLNLTNASIYDGFKAVTNLIWNIVDELKPKETYYVIGAYYGNLPSPATEVPGLRAFFQKHHTRRAKKGIIVKMLANNNLKGKMMPATAIKSEIKYLPQYLITNMQIVFYKNKTIIILFTQSPIAFLIESSEAVESFKIYFDTFWNIAQK